MYFLLLILVSLLSITFSSSTRAQSAPDSAGTLVAIGPGVACTSAAALAKLTQHDGSSLSEGPDATDENRRIAKQGGCSSIVIGQTVRASSIRKNTSVVLADLQDGKGPRTVYVPNVDFRPEFLSDPGSGDARKSLEFPDYKNTSDMECDAGRQCSESEFREQLESIREKWPLVPTSIKAGCVSAPTLAQLYKCIINGSVAWIQTNPGGSLDWLP